MALQIGYGLITGQRPAGSAMSWEEVYDDVLHLVRVAEAAGFDSAWTSEHHFTDDGYMSPLLTAMAAMAVQTSSIALGTNVLLAPLHHPLAVAEQAALVDVLSRGRLLLGLAIGYRDEEFDAYGVAKAERVPRLVEHVELCRKAWTGEPFSHHGPTVDVDDLVVRPTPTRPPPLWLGGWVDESVRRAGRLGDGYLSPIGDLDDTRRRVAILDHEADAAGRDVVGIGTATFVAVHESGAVPTAVSAGLAHMMATYEEWYGSSSDSGGGRDVGTMIGQMRATELPAGVAAGTPQQVIDALGPLASAFPDREHHLVVRLHYPGMGRAEAEDHIGLFADEVTPELRRLGASDRQPVGAP